MDKVRFDQEIKHAEERYRRAIDKARDRLKDYDKEIGSRRGVFCDTFQELQLARGAWSALVRLEEDL